MHSLFQNHHSTPAYLLMEQVCGYFILVLGPLWQGIDDHCIVLVWQQPHINEEYYGKVVCYYLAVDGKLIVLCHCIVFVWQQPYINKETHQWRRLLQKSTLLDMYWRGSTCSLSLHCSCPKETTHQWRILLHSIMLLVSCWWGTTCSLSLYCCCLETSTYWWRRILETVCY